MIMEPQDLTNQDIADMLAAFDEIQMPRSQYMLDRMVVNSEDTPASAYAHCVMEMQISWDNLRIARAQAEIKKLEIQELLDKNYGIEGSGEKADLLNAEIKQVELEQLNRARLGAKREFEYLYAMWRNFSKRYTRAELDADQPDYWSKRLARQANNDILAQGRVSVSNLDALRMIGKGAVPTLDVVRDVEKRYLSQGKSRILVAVPTVEQAINGLPCLDQVTLPATSEIKILNVWGRQIDDAYNYAVQQAIEDDADWLLTVEDDTFPPFDAVIRLLDLARSNPNSAVGAWYPKRERPRQGVHIILQDGKRKFLNDDDDKVHSVYTLAMGCTIYPVSMFLAIPQPWFVTTANLSQDSFFSQLARDYGYKLLVDTSIKCRHIDRVTAEVYS